MCEFISWVKKRDKVYFLTSKQLFSEKGLAFIKENGVSADDYYGHGTIRKWYGIDSGDGEDKECVDFSLPTNFPEVIVRAIKRGDMVGFVMPDRLLTNSLDADYVAKRNSLYADYVAKRKPLYADYEAKRKPLYADYEAKRKPLYADYEAKCNSLDADYEAKCNSLDADYVAKRNSLYADYWSLFVDPENRAEAWR